MLHHDMAILAEVNIEFDPINTGLKAEFKSSQRVLRMESGAALTGDNFWFARLNQSPPRSGL